METATPVFLAVTFVAFFSLFVTVGSQMYVYFKLARRPRRTGPLPPISVLKPLKGTDQQLFENLASIAVQPSGISR